MHQRLYASVEGSTIQLTASGYDLDRLRTFYRPYYDLVETDPGRPYLVSVRLACRGIGGAEPAVTAMSNYLEPSVGRPSADGAATDFARPVADLRVRMSRARSQVEIEGRHPTHVDLQARTLVRDQLFGQIEKSSGWVVFHGAAVQRDGLGVAVLGPRNAGKTTSLLSLMAGGRYDFLSADRVKLRAAGNAVRLRGFPARCNVHRVAVETDPFLAPLASPRRFDTEGKVLIEIGELTGLAGVRQVAQAELAVVLLPDLRGDDSDLTVTRLTRADQINEAVSAQLMEGTPVDKHTHWLHYFPDTMPSLPGRLAAVLSRLPATVVVLAVRGSHAGYTSAIRDGTFDPLRVAGRDRRSR
jgi:hypothetical protein